MSCALFAVLRAVGSSKPAPLEQAPGGCSAPAVWVLRAAAGILQGKSTEMLAARWLLTAEEYLHL